MRIHRTFVGLFRASFFPADFYFEAGSSLNAVEREPVPTSVLNSSESEASYKPKQLSYRKTKLKKSSGEKTGVEKA